MPYSTLAWIEKACPAYARRGHLSFPSFTSRLACVFINQTRTDVPPFLAIWTNIGTFLCSARDAVSIPTPQMCPTWHCVLTTALFFLETCRRVHDSSPVACQLSKPSLEPWTFRLQTSSQRLARQLKRVNLRVLASHLRVLLDAPCSDDYKRS